MKIDRVTCSILSIIIRSVVLRVLPIFRILPLVDEVFSDFIRDAETRDASKFLLCVSLWLKC
jgi:hypothetical protein